MNGYYEKVFDEYISLYNEYIKDVNEWKIAYKKWQEDINTNNYNESDIRKLQEERKKEFWKMKEDFFANTPSSEDRYRFNNMVCAFNRQTEQLVNSLKDKIANERKRINELKSNPPQDPAFIPKYHRPNPNIHTIKYMYDKYNFFRSHILKHGEYELRAKSIDIERKFILYLLSTEFTIKTYHGYDMDNYQHFEYCIYRINTK